MAKRYGTTKQRLEFKGEIKIMGKHFDELVKEKNELVEKIKKLQPFLNEQSIVPQGMRRIDNIQFTLIASQLETMREYLGILNKRIKYDREKKEK